MNQKKADPVVIWRRRWSNIRATRQWWKVLHISATKRSTSKEPLSIYKNNIFMRWVRVKESSLRISSGFSWAWLYGWQVQTLKNAEKKLFSSSINVNKTRRALEAFVHYLEFLFYFFCYTVFDLLIIELKGLTGNWEKNKASGEKKKSWNGKKII